MVQINNKFILGSGISSLIFKFYNQEYKIISPDNKAGGQLTSHPQLLTTFYVHNTSETKLLLEELKIPYKEKRLKIYYYYYGKVLESLTSEQRSRFIKGKLQECGYDSNSVEVNNLNLSVSNNYLDILDCDVNKLIEKLTPKDIIQGSVKLINNNRKFFVYQDKDKQLITQPYDMLISSIPANQFFNLTYNYRAEYYLNYLPSTFISSKQKPWFMTDDNAIYYVLDDNLIFNRVQKFGNEYIYETTGLPTEEEIIKQIPEITNQEKRYVGLIKDEDVRNFKYIKFIGRNACWNSNIKIQDVIKYSLEFKK
jgi:hypothetical protein